MFLQVYNDSHTPQPAATDLTISDTQGNGYIPIVPGPTNAFAYRGGTVPANGRLPAPTRSPPTAPRRARCCCSRSRSSRSTTAR